MKRKTICIVMIFVLAFTFCLSGGIVYAETLQEKQDELANAQSEAADLGEKLKDVQAQIDEKQPEVDALNAEVAEANAKVAEIEDEITKKQQEMEEREDGLNARLRVMYKNGAVGFMDVLLGSRSISEFISNLEMIQQIYENDMNVLDTLEKEQEELKKIGEQLKAEKAVLDQKKAELDAEMDKLYKLEAEIEAAEVEFQKEAERLTEEIEDLVSKDTEYVGGDYIWPVPYTRNVTSKFGPRPVHPYHGEPSYHYGIDIASYGCNETNIVAAASGTVIKSEWWGGYGNCIIIDHGGGVTTRYGHLSKRSVRVGQTVSGGQVIGLLGDTGWSTGPHLHFEIRFSGVAKDPLLYF